MVQAVSAETRRRYEEAREPEDERAITEEDIERAKARIGVSGRPGLPRLGLRLVPVVLTADRAWARVAVGVRVELIQP